jgi:hypothetical protein
MVQKISNYTGNLALSANFEPIAFSGVTISHSGGAVSGNGAIKETVAGDVTVPSSGTWSVYASLLTGLLVASATSAVPTTDAIVIWFGTSSGGAITDFNDVRTWAATDTISGTEGFNEYLTGQFNLVHDWKCDETSGNSTADSGTGTNGDLINSRPIGMTPGVTGDVGYETDNGIGSDGTGGSIADTSAPNLGLTAGATGHFGIVFKTNTATSNSMSVQDIMFTYGSSSTTQFMMFRGAGSGSTTRMEVRLLTTGTLNDSLTRCQNIGGLDDDNYHLWVCDQRGDGNGPQHYVDGVLYDNTSTGSATNYPGTGSPDHWWDDSPSAGRIALASAAALGNNIWDGAFSRCWISDDNVSDAQMTKLNLARTQLV